MMAAVDDDDFIVQSEDVPACSDDAQGLGARAAAVGVGSGAFGWEGLKRLGGLVFANGATSEGCDAAAEPEPSLPPGFSVLLNAEEEEIYPAEVCTYVLACV